MSTQYYALSDDRYQQTGVTLYRDEQVCGQACGVSIAARQGNDGVWVDLPALTHTRACCKLRQQAQAGRCMGGTPKDADCVSFGLSPPHTGGGSSNPLHTLSDSTSHREGGWLLHRLSLQTTAYRLRHPETGNFIQFLVSNTAKSEVCSATGCGEPSVLSLCLKAQVKVLPRFYS